MDKKQLGYYAGYLISAFYLGQLPGSAFWGWIADKYGRKKPIVLIVLRLRSLVHSVLVDTICVFGFAFIRNYYVAVAVRFVWGFLDGHYPLIKTLVTDYSNARNVARNTSFLFLSVAMGKLRSLLVIIRSAFSPLLGGYLSNPDNLSPWLVEHIPILREKQFCFPFLFCGCLLALCISFVFGSP